MLWAGGCVDFIAEVAPAGDLVARIGAEGQDVPMQRRAPRGGSDFSTSVGSP